MKSLTFLAALGLLGCVTKREMRELPSDTGNAATYDAPFDKVRRSCEDTMAADSWKRSQNEKDTRFVEAKVYQIIGTQNLSSGTAGWRVRIRIEDKGSQCIVRVIVRSKIESHENENAETLLAEDLQKKIAERVAK